METSSTSKKTISPQFIANRRRRRRRWIAFFVVLAAGSVVAYNWMPRPAEEVADDEPAVITEPLIVTIGYGNIENAIAAIGALRPSETVPVRPHVSGRLTETYVGVGDVVEQGEPLALVEQTFESSSTEVTAPLSGTVISVDERAGALLDATQDAPTIMQIADLTTMTVEAEVFEGQVAALEEGMPAYITPLDSREPRWHGNLRRILPTPTSSEGAVFYTALFEVDNSDGALYSGMTAQAFFVTSLVENVLTVPIGALTFTGVTGVTGDTRNAAVEVALPDDTTETREIVVGATDRARAEVLSGLVEGERVVAGVIEILPPEAEEPNAFDPLNITPEIRR